MKKFMTMGLVAAMAVATAGADDGVVMVDQTAGTDVVAAEVSAELALVSSYVWRGQVLNNDFVAQPQVTLAHKGFSFNIWGNYDLAGSSYTGVSHDFSEIDMSLAYTLPLAINEMAVDVGVINYDFPANGSGNTGAPSTTELFIKGTVLSWQDYVIPSMTIFGDIDEANGTYVLLDVVAPYQVSDYLAVEGGISAGYGNTSYNDYYFGGNQDANWNDFNFYGNASYEIAENLTASLNLTYTMLNGGAIEDAAGQIYEAKEKFWGGVNIAYDF